MEIGEADSGSERELRVGETLAIALPEARTAGYRWQIVSDGAPSLSLADAGHAPGGNAPGARGERRWIVTAVRPGAGTIAADYRRSFGGAPASRSFSLRLVVR